MNGNNKKHLLLCLLIPPAVGGLGALLAGDMRSAYQAYYKPLLSPPAWVFPVVWTVLYLLMGYAAYLVLSSGATAPRKRRALTAFAVQLGLNLLWPLFFFRFCWFCFSFLWLLALIAAALACWLLFRFIVKCAGDLLLPYLLWLCFAAYLNLGVCLLN